MAKTKRVKKKVKARAKVATRKAAPVRRRKPTPRGKPTTTRAPSFLAVRGATRQDSGEVRLEVGRAGEARVKRVIYPAGFRWSVDMKPVVNTDLCMHAHVGFLESGKIRIEYADGCVVDYEAPQVVAIDPGHDGAVIGDEPAVLIELDFERDTVARLGMPSTHQHG